MIFSRIVLAFYIGQSLKKQKEKKIQTEKSVEKETKIRV